MTTNPKKENSPLIFVVDDDKSMRLLLRVALEQEGYQVLEAQDGAAALAAYENHLPDAILLDAVMPGMDLIMKLKINHSVKVRSCTVFAQV
ncbi:response regulator [Iningainema tapete]|uniref:Response regulator n=1 Tax=Iningainema tapete BLCC-T55 TaxID=2748662 RepID=A0A8J7CA55_9CYAN|nr:response regulator [Iningainema tapete BLCC-T55]